MIRQNAWTLNWHGAASWLVALGLGASSGCIGLHNQPPSVVRDEPAQATTGPRHEPNPIPAPKPRETLPTPAAGQQDAIASEPMPIDLATALRLVDESSPTINLARERVREAMARVDQADVLWLPTLQGGPAYQRHDGQLQRSTGEVIQVSKSNLFIGGGAEARFDLAEAYFAPLVARRLTQAEIENSRAVTNNVQLEVASAYLDLLQVYAALDINADITGRALDMVKAADGADATGLIRIKGDTNRARTELNLRREERIVLEGQAAAVSARLAQLLYLQPTIDLRPVEKVVVPITLVPEGLPLDEMVATAMLNRPELASNRALVDVALERWRQARYGPLIPKIDVGYYAGDFGGGKHEFMGDFDGRGDGLAQVTWQLQNLGFGDVALSQQRRSQYNQAMLHVNEIQAQVGAEVSTAAKIAQARRKAMASAAEAVVQAEEMWRKLKELAFGLGADQKLVDVVQPLLAMQALAQARAQYLAQVIEYNRAQFQLYAAMGQPPVESLPQATTVPLPSPVVPPVPYVAKPAKEQP